MLAGIVLKRMIAMNREIYTQIYRRLDKVTPLPVDCGRSCGAACCEDNETGTGMYLFPGEEAMHLLPFPGEETMFSLPEEKKTHLFSGEEGVLREESDWLRLTPSEFMVEGRPVQLATCGGSCPRHLRPLSCRIFPLVPYAKRGSRMRIIMDPRARPLCPLARVLQPRDLEPDFYKNVRRCMQLLMKFHATRAFIYEQSELIDELCGPFLDL